MISLIWAMTKERVIGLNNAIPWHYKEDFKYFKEKTMGHKVLMGYNTYLSIKKLNPTLLPGRTNMVLFDGALEDENAILVSNLKEFIETYKNSEEEVFIIGGASVYAQTLEDANKLYVTIINKVYKGDTFFPVVDFDKYNLINERIDNELTFFIYKKK